MHESLTHYLFRHAIYSEIFFFLPIRCQLPVKRRLCLFLGLIFKQIFEKDFSATICRRGLKFSHIICYGAGMPYVGIYFCTNQMSRGYYPWESASRYLVSYTGYCCNLKYFHSLQYMYLEYQPSIACMKGFFFSKQGVVNCVQYLFPKFILSQISL